MNDTTTRRTAELAPVRRWMRAEYARRTAAVEAGTAPIDWADPGTRVAFSECVAKAQELGIFMPLPDLRAALGTIGGRP